MSRNRGSEFLRRIFGKPVPMFERYTQNARRTIFFGRWEAIQLSSEFIESDHLALGLLRDEWLASDLLSDVALADWRRELSAPIIEGAESKTGRDLPLSSESKRVLQQAAEEADALLDSHIGNEHLLLGLLREKRSHAARALVRGGLKLEVLRLRVKQIPRQTRESKGSEQVAKWQADGIPEGYAWPRLFYNAASQTIVVELQAPGDESHRARRLFMRYIGSEVYEPIGNPHEDISYESMVTCEKRPLIAFNSMRHTKGSGDWVGVLTFDLAKRELSVCVSKANFLAPAPYTGGWIAQLLGLAEDGSHAYVKAGLEVRHEHGADMHYYVASLDLRSRELMPISRLKDVFF
jgi:hypothetical protein